MKNSYALFAFLVCFLLLVSCGGTQTPQEATPTETTPIEEPVVEETEPVSDDEIEEEIDVEDVEEDIPVDDAEEDYGDII